MPQGLVIGLGVLAGLLVVGGALFLAFWPEMRAKPRKSRLPEPSGARDDYPYGFNAEIGPTDHV